MIEKFPLHIDRQLQSLWPPPDLRKVCRLATDLWDSTRNNPYPTTPIGRVSDLDAFFMETPRHAELCAAFKQAYRVETRILLRRDREKHPDHDIEMQIRFFRGRPREQFYYLIVLFDKKTKDLMLGERWKGLNFYSKTVALQMSQLVESQIVPRNTDCPVNIAIKDGETLRIRWGGWYRNHFPHGLDRFHVHHFRNGSQVSFVTIAPSSFCQYLVDLGHGLVLHPGTRVGEEVISQNQSLPDLHRCKDWSVRLYNRAEWGKGVPVKTAAELIEKD